MVESAPEHHPENLAEGHLDPSAEPQPSEPAQSLAEAVEPVKEFLVGDRVRVLTLPPYVKTAEPMPMLRPPNVIRVGEEGTIVDRRPGNYWSVRFQKGVFLLDSQYLERLPA